MSLFERYLSVWVALCIMAGIVLGQLAPGVFQFLASLEYASVNLPMVNAPSKSKVRRAANGSCAAGAASLTDGDAGGVPSSDSDAGA